MSATTNSKKYSPTIGIECHVQLKTNTKLFAGVSNDAKQAAPNSLVSHICFGLPGALPVLNKEALHLAIRAAFALNVSPQKFSKFDRKHYFYPDLPKGYQITQFDQPIILGGNVTIEANGGAQKIAVTRAHLEEDAGKSTHPSGKDYSLVDLNRAGTPLLEIVSEPDMHSSAEAKAYVRELYLCMRYADVSDANLYFGNMRFDVNVSVSAQPGTLGTRTETKNLNSFRAVEKAVDYEIKRQVDLLEKGQRIIQETRGWHDTKQKTFSQRSKEEANDYRYFPEPDLPPVVLDDDFVKMVLKEMPIMPAEWRDRLEALGLDKSHIETLLDAEIEEEGVRYLSLIETHLAEPNFARSIANWEINVEIPQRRAGEIKHPIDDDTKSKIFSATYQLVQTDKLSSSRAKDLIIALFNQTELPENIEAFAQTKGYIQESDEDAIASIVAKVLTDNPAAAQDVKDGQLKAIGFLVGQVMKLSAGKANPGLAQTLIKKQLEIS